MATNYPGSLDSGTQQPSPSSSTEMDDSGFEHDVVHTNHSGAIIALETKVGTGDSNAVASSVLAGTGSGTSGWTTTPTVTGLTVNGDTSSTGHFTAQSGGADSGIVLGQAFSTDYVGLRTAGMAEASNNEYVLISDGTITLLSGGTNGDVYIRGGANNSSCQVPRHVGEQDWANWLNRDQRQLAVVCSGRKRDRQVHGQRAIRRRHNRNVEHKLLRQERFGRGDPVPRVEQLFVL